MLLQFLSDHWIFSVEIFIVSCLIFWIKNEIFHAENQLPGPIGIPILGYIPFLGKYPYKVITKLGETYGPIFKVPFGLRTAIVLNDYETIVEAYSKDISFSGRPLVPSIETLANSGRSRFAFKPVKNQTLGN